MPLRRRRSGRKRHILERNRGSAPDVPSPAISSRDPSGEATVDFAQLGEFAIVYGFKQFNPVVTWAAVLIIIVIVQGVQFIGNALARKVLRR